MGKIERAHSGHLVQLPSSSRAILEEHIAQDCIQKGLEYLQWERLQNLPGQPVPVHGHCTVKFFLCTFLCFSLCLCLLLLDTTEESLASSSWHLPLQFPYIYWLFLFIFSSVPSAGQRDALLWVWASVAKEGFRNWDTWSWLCQVHERREQEEACCWHWSFWTTEAGLWGMDGRYGRQLNLQPGWTVLQFWREIIQYEWLWSCFCISKPYCNAKELSMWSTTKGIPCGIIQLDIIMLKKSHLHVNTNLSSFSLPSYILAKASRVLHFSVLCAWFALMPVCSHSTLIIWAPCKPWRAFLHYSLLQQMFMFTTLLTLLAYLPLSKQFVLCSDCGVYFGQYFNKGLVWVCAY